MEKDLYKYSEAVEEGLHLQFAKIIEKGEEYERF